MTLPKSKDGLLTYLWWCDRRSAQQDAEIQSLQFEVEKLKERNRILTEELTNWPIECDTKH
jgi:hypothetical protein